MRCHKKILTCVAGLFLLSLWWPVDLSNVALSPSLLDHNNKLLRCYGAPDGQIRLPIAIKDVDPLFFNMLLSYEDQRFRYHPGFDPLALVRATLQFFSQNKIISGGSTITMQVAKLLNPAPRTLTTKVIEIWRAMRLEMQYSKDAILNLYLVLAPYGGNIVGLRAASLIYFNKEPSYLTPDEIALLVVIPQNPNRYRPDRFPKQAQAARDKVLKLLYNKKIITCYSLDAGLHSKIPLTRFKLPFHAPHVGDLMLSKHVPSPWVTTLDGDLQKKLENILYNHLQKISAHSSVAVLVVDNTSHAMLAYVGNIDYFNAERAGQVDMIQATRSPGSTLKPFLYGFAFQDGIIDPETIIYDKPTNFGNYKPNNFNQDFSGAVSIRHALQQSLNIPAVKILTQVGPQRFLARLKQTGVKFVLPAQSMLPDLPIILGSVGINLWDLANLYNCLANKGKFYPLRLLHSDPQDGFKTIFNKQSVDKVTSILNETPLGNHVVRGPELSNLAVKTGTSYGYRDALAMAYNSQCTIAVWVGRPDGAFTPGYTGQGMAIPIVLSIYSALPARYRETPARSTSHRRAYDKLPASLKIWKQDQRNALANRVNDTQLKIVFPINSSNFKLDAAKINGIVLTAQNGHRPFYWYINGLFFKTETAQDIVRWYPHSPGDHKITVQDSLGKSAVCKVIIS